MIVISMRQLLEIGVHFGHQTRRWNPKMKKYISTERNGIYIVDLQKTAKLVDAAYDYIKNVAEGGNVALFIGTKKQAQKAIKDEAIRADQYYVNHRQLGGTLANWDTVQKRTARLEEINAMEEDGTFEVLPKKEVVGLNKGREHLEKSLNDITDMLRISDVMYIVDLRRERTIVQETYKLSIPIVATVDINCDPDEIDVVIPSNSGAIRAMRLITVKMTGAFTEGSRGEDQATEELFVEETPEATLIEEIADVVRRSNELAE